MAEGQTGILKRLQSEVTCALCLDIFTEPKKLPCDHVYCRGCLHGLALRSRSSGSSISCPECRVSAPIPSNGITGFPAAHQVNRLLEMYQESLKLSSTEVQPQGYVPPPVPQPEPQPTTCRIHSSQALDFFCETCEKLVCSYCVLTSCTKKNHKYEFLDDMIKTYQNTLRKELEPMKRLHRDMKGTLDELLASKKEILKSKEKNTKNIEEHFDALIEVLKSEKGLLIYQANQTYEEQNNILTAKCNDLLESMAGLESLIDSVDSSMSVTESKSAFLSNFPRKKKALQQYKQKSAAQLGSFELPELDFSMCSKDELEKFMQEKNFSFTKSDPLMCRIERPHNIAMLYMDKERSCTLLVNPENFTTARSGKLNISAELRHFHHNELSKRVSVTEIAKQKFSLSLVPKFPGKSEIIIKSNNEVVSQIPTYVIGSLSQLSCKWLKGACALKFHEGKLYGSEASTALNVIDPSTLSVESVIKVPGINEFAVDGSHLYITDCIQHQLTKMKLDGTIIASTGKKGNGPGEFEYPNGIRISKDKEIYVSDSNNNRIQVFDKNLKLQRMIGKKGSDDACFQSPDDLDFDEDGNIYVADQSNRRIQVLTAYGKHIRNIGRSSSSQRELLVHPISPAVHKGFVYVTDSFHQCVFVFKTTGEFVKRLAEDLLPGPECLTIDESDRLYVSFSRSLFVKILL